jgi:hypothetical protein
MRVWFAQKLYDLADWMLKDTYIDFDLDFDDCDCGCGDE